MNGNASFQNPRFGRARAIVWLSASGDRYLVRDIINLGMFVKIIAFNAF